MSEKVKSTLLTQYRVNYQFVMNRKLRTGSLVENQTSIEAAKESADKYLASVHPEGYKITSVTQW